MIDTQRQNEIMQMLIALCDEAIARGDEPFVGALTDARGNLLCTAQNTENTDCNPSLHAEMNLLNKACAVYKTKQFEDCCVFTNAEPCSMCSSAWIKAGVRSFYYGADVEPHCDPLIPINDVAGKAHNSLLVVGGICEEECVAQIKRGREELQKRAEANLPNMV